MTSARLICDDGSVIGLDVERWMGDASPDERTLLRRVTSPVLDIGCGPGRHVLALAHSGKIALGVDPAPSAVKLARGRGATVMRRSVFDRLPGSGRWRSVLLLDGNIGIGGDPQALLRRVAQLLSYGGVALVELEAPGVAMTNLRARIETESETTGLFPWAVLGADDIRTVAARSGFSVDDVWSQGSRWFAALRRT